MTPRGGHFFKENAPSMGSFFQKNDPLGGVKKNKTKNDCFCRKFARFLDFWFKLKEFFRKICGRFQENLFEFSVKSVTEGIDALGEVTIRIRNKGKIYSGHSADTDVVVAAANAYVNALNRLVFSEKRNSIHPQFDGINKAHKKTYSN